MVEGDPIPVYGEGKPEPTGEAEGEKGEGFSILVHISTHTNLHTTEPLSVVHAYPFQTDPESLSGTCGGRGPHSRLR